MVLSDPLLWSLIPFALCWSVWLARKDVNFQNKTFDPTFMWDLHVLRIGWWIQAWWKECPFRDVLILLEL